MGATFAQKVLARAADREHARVGEILTVRPARLLSHDNTAAIIGKIEGELGEYGLDRADLPVVVLDHVAPARDTKTAENHRRIREYAERHGVEDFYDVGEGICHQVMVERALARPGDVVVGSDSHTCTYGALNAFATGIDRTEAAAVLLTGETWFKVPPSIKVVLQGTLPRCSTAKDLVLTLIGRIGADGAAYRAVEFHGALEGLSMDDRMTIANMGVEMGAKAAAFPVDERTRAYLKGIDPEWEESRAVWADGDAEYDRVIEMDLEEIVPVAARPGRVDEVVPVTEVAGTPIEQVLIGTCTNGRLSDLRGAAAMLRDRQRAPSVRLLILPASRRVFEEALEDGTITELSRAGGVVLPTGCGPCMGAHMGVLAPGETCFSTSNRNFPGRMGTKEADIYLGSPLTAAASAVTGVIIDPRQMYPEGGGA
ncbi:MAG: 3-isopropylmalate dehydratase large subunit [bacterium]